MEREDLTERSWLARGRCPVEIDWEALWALRPDFPGVLVMHGRSVPMPRLQTAYGRDYSFSGQTSVALPIPPELQGVVDWANSLGMGEFQALLVNWYATGSHYIGAHSDNTAPLVHGSPIITVSLGATRCFRVRTRAGQRVIDLHPADGDFIVMGGAFQAEFKHEITKVARAGPRISITLRRFR
jgi:alkylated DNA repair dioxygenase AlkB